MGTRRWTLMMVACTLSGIVIGNIVLHDQFGLASQEAKPMNVSRITVEHVRVATDKPFDKVTKAFEQPLGKFNDETYSNLASGEDAAKVRAKLEAMVGPSGFMLFRTSDHGSLLRLVGKKKKAIQYLVSSATSASRR